MSFEPRFTVTNAITADLTRIERARGVLGSSDTLRGLDTADGRSCVLHVRVGNST